MFASFLATYGAVFGAELAGDKLLYTTGVLAARYRTIPILCGMLAAFMAKMGLAVLAGSALSMLPKPVVAAVTTANFFAIAYAIWCKPKIRAKARERSSPRAAVMSFSAIFLSEWGDVGQITAATMAARFGAPWLVWSAAVAAMATKGAAAVCLGAGVRRWIRERLAPETIRYVAVGLLLFLGFLSVLETLSGGHSMNAALLRNAR